MKEKRLLGLFVVSLLVLGLLISGVGVVSAAEKTVGEKLGEAIGSFFGDIFGGSSVDKSTPAFFDVGGGFSWFLIFSLVALVVYAVSPFLPFFDEHGWISGAVSVVVALLSTFFLSKEEIATILLSYNALGIAVTGIIPFFAIAAIAKKANEKQHFFFAKLLWVAFMVVLFFRWIFAGESELGQFGFYAYLAMFFIAIVMLIWENRIYLFLFKRRMEQTVPVLKKGRITRLRGKAAELADQIIAAKDQAVKDDLIRQHDQVARDLKKLGSNYGKWGSL
tara:strand:+ start:2745 stop:3578 length:834 start_codon:yes stop_codon:yes gene_type:complete